MQRLERRRAADFDQARSAFFERAFVFDPSLSLRSVKALLNCSGVGGGGFSAGGFDSVFAWGAA